MTAPLVAAKFRPPAVDPGIVPRTALVERLLAAPPCPVVCVTAPPGYGKTTFLAQWASDPSRGLAWVSMAVGASSLTTAELRIIPYLATYLSLGEIAERMHAFRNTIKTHTNSIYQKLGVSSRSEANRRVAEIGLLVP